MNANKEPNFLGLIAAGEKLPEVGLLALIPIVTEAVEKEV